MGGAAAVFIFMSVTALKITILTRLDTVYSYEILTVAKLITVVISMNI